MTPPLFFTICPERTKKWGEDRQLEAKQINLIIKNIAVMSVPDAHLLGGKACDLVGCP